jgi:hypothetical protein
VSQLLEQRPIAPGHSLGQRNFRTGPDHAAEIQDRLDDCLKISIVSRHDPAENIGITGHRMGFYDLG